MRQQAMSSRMVFNRPIPVNRLVSSIADSSLLRPHFNYDIDLHFYQRLKLTHRSMEGVRTE